MTQIVPVAPDPYNEEGEARLQLIGTIEVALEEVVIFEVFVSTNCTRELFINEEMFVHRVIG
ncbi:MAG: hypothetical protein EBX37_19480 [Alphaproteobacteria bacterium]|nr:hypothetical protein [Alphaproteobacteria bacterium]